MTTFFICLYLAVAATFYSVGYLTTDRKVLNTFFAVIGSLLWPLMILIIWIMVYADRQESKVSDQDA